MSRRPAERVPLRASFWISAASLEHLRTHAASRRTLRGGVSVCLWNCAGDVMRGLGAVRITVEERRKRRP